MGFLVTFLSGFFLMVGAVSYSASGELAQEIARELDAPPAGGTGPQLAAEDQTPTGKFTTATEVRPILGATRASWIAVREYDGQDLLYFTNLLAWRCGLVQVDYAINGGDFVPLAIEPCYTDTAMPNAIKAEEILPYVAFPLSAIDSVTVRITYDDLGEEIASFTRSEVLMP